MAGFYGDLAKRAGDDNNSEVSDVDPAEMAKMLEGLDDMDADLFGSSSKTSNSQVKSALKSPAISSAAEKSNKSRVKFVTADKDKPTGKSFDDDFDADDPLADLLSDEDSVSLKKPKPVLTTKEEPPAVSSVKGVQIKDNAQKAKVIADLFGLDGEEESKLAKVEEPAPSIINKDKKKEDTVLKAREESEEAIIPRSKTGLLKPKSEEILIPRTAKQSLGVSRLRSDGIKFDDTDILEGMGFESERKMGQGDSSGGKPKTARTKSVMDELFGKRPPPKEEDLNFNITDVKKSSSKSELTPNDSVSFGGYSPTITINREPRRPRRNPSIVDDPLGLFSPPQTPHRNPVQDSGGETYTSPVKGRTIASADWLGISGDKDNKPSDVPSVDHKKSLSGEGISDTHPRIRASPTRRRNSGISSDLPDWLGGGGGGGGEGSRVKPVEPSVPVQQKAPEKQAEIPPKVEQASEKPLGVVSELLANNQFEQQAMLAMQRQEAALLAAAGLQAHEARLTEVQRRQQALLDQQEAQLRHLVERQVERQQMLEEQLRAQQERISSHVQALLKQPPGIPVFEVPVITQPAVVVSTPPSVPATTSTPAPVPATALSEAPAAPAETGRKEDYSAMQAALQESELQKKYQEVKLEKLEIKHKEEVQLLEECYKRQMQILEEALKKQEERLRAENERLEGDYKQRIVRMQEQNARLVEEYGRQMEALQQERIAEMQQLRQQQGAMLDHIQQAQKAETVAIRGASEHLSTLQATVELLGRNAGGLGELQSRLEQQQCTQSEAREAALKAKEAELQESKESLKRQQQAAEEENRRLTELTELVSKQRREVEDEQRSLCTESKRINIEREQLNTDRQELDRLKQSVLEDQKVTRKKLSEERVSIAAERSRVEALSRVQASPTSQDGVLQMKAEAESALTVAREATEQAQRERLSLKEQQRHLDAERRRLAELEHDLSIRARELEALAEKSMLTRNEGIEALAETARSEREQSERAVDLKQQLHELQDREQRLVKEKLSLSQERLAMRKNKEQRLCSSCKGPLVRTSGSVDCSIAPSISAHDKFVDPKVVILKLVAEKERSALENNWSSHFSVSK